MVVAASVSHGRQRESVHCPRRWYFCAWRRLPGSRSETVEDDAGEEAPYMTTTVDRLQCGVRGRRLGRCAAVGECADVRGRSTKTAVPWRSLFYSGDRKWGVFRCTTLGAGVGLAG